MNELFGGDDRLIIQWTTSRGLVSHHWTIPLAPLWIAGYVIMVVGVNILQRSAAKK